jgi:ribosomal protein S18 acetylase RimI-like enzyme
MFTEKDVRLATTADTDSIGHLLNAFNNEYDEPTPNAKELSDRFKELFDHGDTSVLLGGNGPDGLAVLRFRLSIWSRSLECYLAELYVMPESRGKHLGHHLLKAAIELAKQKGADYMDLGTSEADVAAIKLYESFGFSNHESRPDGPIMYVYEREL